MSLDLVFVVLGISLRFLMAPLRILVLVIAICFRVDGWCVCDDSDPIFLFFIRVIFDVDTVYTRLVLPSRW